MSQLRKSFFAVSLALALFAAPAFAASSSGSASTSGSDLGVIHALWTDLLGLFGLSAGSEGGGEFGEIIDPGGLQSSSGGSFDTDADPDELGEMIDPSGNDLTTQSDTNSDDEFGQMIDPNG